MGSPAGGGLAWPRVEGGHAQTLVVGDTLQAADDPSGAQLDFYARRSR